MDGLRLAGERVLTHRRALPIPLILALLALGASVFVTASSSSRAEAICTGVGQPLTIYHVDGNGVVVAAEGAPYPGSTCNNDSRYSGLVLDAVTDGSCAYTYYLEPLLYYAQQGASCTTGSWSAYGYDDSIGTNSVFVSVRPSYLGDEWRASSGY
jgi:hypothetical protein